jgi:hypothetical protein
MHSLINIYICIDGNKKQDGRQRDQKPTDHEAVSRFRKIEARKKR